MSELEKPFAKPELPIVAVQGLGFVGSAMALSVANAVAGDEAPYFNVVGVELDNEAGRRKVDLLNGGELPVKSSDPKMLAAMERANKQGNLVATTAQDIYARASIVIVDIHLDVNMTDLKNPSVDFTGIKKAVETIAQTIPAGGLILVETTVPPGTCKNVLWPVIQDCEKARGLESGSILLAHSYERVMPGKDYFDSIVNFWRVYSGTTDRAANATQEFLEKLINTKEFPLTRLKSTTDSETAKVLENSYRATNIAFIEEWGRFAEKFDVDLYGVLNAIRVRPTHNNIRQPGFGVGGYCLTKDPLLGMVSARQIFDSPEMEFPFSQRAVVVNQDMPNVTLRWIEQIYNGDIAQKRFLVLGVSYRQDVADTRYSPTEPFVAALEKAGASVQVHDPIVEFWEEREMKIPKDLPDASSFDMVVFCVPHGCYRERDFTEWAGSNRVQFFDANNVLSNDQIEQLNAKNFAFYSIGRGMSL